MVTWHVEFELRISISIRTFMLRVDRILWLVSKCYCTVNGSNTTNEWTEISKRMKFVHFNFTNKSLHTNCVVSTREVYVIRFRRWIEFPLLTDAIRNSSDVDKRLHCVGQVLNFNLYGVHSSWMVWFCVNKEHMNIIDSTLSHCRVPWFYYYSSYGTVGVCWTIGDNQWNSISNR